MNLFATLSLFFGGPGSGCNGPNCGRPEGPDHDPVVYKKDFISDESNKKALDELNNPPKEKKWRTFNPNSVGGYFRHGTTIAEMYKTLSAKQGEWHPISDFETTHAGKANIKNRIQELKYTGKRSGLWHVEVSGNSVRIYLKTKEEKAQLVMSDAKNALATDLAKKVIQLQKEWALAHSYAATVTGEMEEKESKKLFTQYFKDMGVSDASRNAMEQGIKSWTGSANQTSAQAWRQAAMEFYGRKPDGEYTDSETKQIGSEELSKKVALMKDGVMAMKAYASAYAVANDINTVYRGIGEKAGAQIRKALQDGATKIEVPMNSLSSWSSRKTIGFGDVVVAMKIDPDNVWAIHKATPWLFSGYATEQEYVIGARSPIETFSPKDIKVKSMGAHW